MKVDLFQYVNPTDCGRCKHYDAKNRLCDYYLNTGKHRN